MRKINQSLILALIFLTVLIIHFASRNINIADSRWSVPTALSIIKEGNTNLDEYKEIIADNDYTIEQINGHIYANYPIGPALIAVPFVFVIDKGLNLLSVRFPRLTVSIKAYIKARNHTGPIPDIINTITISPGIELFVASFVIALASVFIYLIGKIFLNREGSLLITFIFAFCTSSWSIASRALWQHGPSMLMLTVALYLILLAKDRPRLAPLVGIPLAFSCVIRGQNIISCVLLSAFVLLQYKKYWKFYFLSTAVVIVPFFLFNLAVYHSLLSPYYLLKYNG